MSRQLGPLEFYLTVNEGATPAQAIEDARIALDWALKNSPEHVTTYRQFVTEAEEFLAWYEAICDGPQCGALSVFDALYCWRHGLDPHVTWPLPEGLDDG